VLSKNATIGGGGLFDPLLGWRGCQKRLGIEGLSLLFTWLAYPCKNYYVTETSIQYKACRCTSAIHTHMLYVMQTPRMR